MKVFDYLFYRLYSFYLSKDKNGSPLFTSILYLSFIQIIGIYLVIASYFVVTRDYFNILDVLQQNKGLAKFLLVIFGICLEIANYYRYGNWMRRDKLVNRYRANKFNRSLKLWMLLPILGFCIFLPFFAFKSDYVFKSVLGLAAK